MNKLGVIGANKRGKTFEDHEFGNNLLKEEVCGNLMSVKYDVLMEDGCPVDKIGKAFYRYDSQIIYIFLNILCLTTETRGPFAE